MERYELIGHMMRAYQLESRMLKGIPNYVAFIVDRYSVRLYESDPASYSADAVEADVLQICAAQKQFHLVQDDSALTAAASEAVFRA